MKLREILTYFTDTIFRRSLDEWRNPVVRWFVQQYRLLFYTARGLLEHGTTVRSAALTFYTLMSLVPIVAVIFAVMKGFGLADKLTENLYALFPQSPETIDYIISFAEKALARTQGGVVAAVALVMLFWAVIRVFASIESAFNNIWEVKVERSITRQYTDYIAVVMIVPILWILANAVGNYAGELLGEHDGWGFALLSRLFSMVVIWVMFTFLYMIIPNARVRLRYVVIGALVATLLWMGLSRLFSYYVVVFAQRLNSYKTIGAFILMMMWLDFSGMIVMIGAIVNATCQVLVDGPVSQRPYFWQWIHERIKKVGGK